MSGTLDRILQSKHAELEALRRAALTQRYTPRPLQLQRSASSPLHLITEIKRRSPSAGPLSTALAVGARARAYQEAGASMLSVLCDGPFFDGSYEHLSEAREACTLPLLCKEFILDECQLDAARAYGADAVLLIVRCLAPERLRELIEAANQRSLLPLVEVHGLDELPIALDAGARVVGVNARDLDTLRVDVAAAARTLERIPDEVVRVQLSGVKSAEDVAAIARGRADAALIGEVLMRQDDPRPLLAQMRAAAAAASPTD